MKVLVDTSVWVNHFKQGNQKLIELLVDDKVLCHPFVVGEIACGTPPSPRRRTIADLQLLSSAHIATNEEIHYLIEQNELYGKGCGLIDIALLASVLLTPDTMLWTVDKRLQVLSANFEVLYLA